METIGIICEYNPLHLGHKKQLDMIRQALGEDTAIVCLMSGNFVQRGYPAIFHRSLRANAAILAGADLVLQMPVTTSLSSAEGFAAGSVALLGKFCDKLCFGAENADTENLMRTAKALLSEEFSIFLRTHLDAGLSFPAARQKALTDMGCDSSLLSLPNNILAVEYCKAILTQNSSMTPMPIFRGGNYHDTDIDLENPSATALRALIEGNEQWMAFVPQSAHSIFANAPVHTLDAGQRAVLAKLRSMTEEEFAALPYGSEGLGRKLMHAVRTENTLEQIATAVKSKRYTRSRIDRMILCAFLGITQADIAAPVPYARVLALNEKGGKVLKIARQAGFFPNISEKVDHPFALLENRCDALYGLFSTTAVESYNSEDKIYYHSI